MKNTFGNSLSVTLFGESHGPEIGAVLDGIAPGIAVDTDYIAEKLTLRRPSGTLSTARREKDEFRIVSGVCNGKTTGTPLCILLKNNDTRPEDYAGLESAARPGHADYTAEQKYHGFQDAEGGGHFSGRITAALVAAGSVVESALMRKNIYIGTHIAECGGVRDREFDDLDADLRQLNGKAFAVLDDAAGQRMRECIELAAAAQDSVGGILETAVTGMPAGVGEPWFDTVEGELAHALFSVPAVKGVEFGAGFAFSGMRGSRANDPFRAENGRIFTLTNNNGGVNGGITNGMPLIFRCAVKPTPSIAAEQKTVNYKTGENVGLRITGRHDPCIVHRARAVADSVTALVLGDMLALRFGTDWLCKV